MLQRAIPLVCLHFMFLPCFVFSFLANMSLCPKISNYQAILFRCLGHGYLGNTVHNTLEWLYVRFFSFFGPESRVLGVFIGSREEP